MIFDPDELIISKPEFLRTNQKVGSFFTFLLFWAIFLFLLRPFVMFFGWLFTAYILKKNLVNIDNFYYTFIEPVLPYSIIIAFMLVIFPIWMMYNKRRFSGFKDRRAQAAHKTLGDRVMDDMKVTLDDYKTAIKCEALVVCFDEEANIISVRDLCPPDWYMPEFVFDDGAEEASVADDFRVHRPAEDAWWYDDEALEAKLRRDADSCGMQTLTFGEDGRVEEVMSTCAVAAGDARTTAETSQNNELRHSGPVNDASPAGLRRQRQKKTFIAPGNTDAQNDFKGK